MKGTAMDYPDGFARFARRQPPKPPRAARPPMTRTSVNLEMEVVRDVQALGLNVSAICRDALRQVAGATKGAAA